MIYIPTIESIEAVKASVTYDDGQNARVDGMMPCPFCGPHDGSLAPFVQYGPEWGDGSMDARVVCPVCHVATTRATGSPWTVAATGERVSKWLAIMGAVRLWNTRDGGEMQYRKLMVCMTDDAGYVPAYAHDGDAGLDLRAVEDYTIPAGGSVMVRTGLRVEIPHGCVGLEFPRSGLGSRGLTMRNAVGVIDSGFRGEVMCPLWNTTDEPFEVRRGDRVCQLVVMPYCPCTIVEADELSDSERGTDGYGSTGVR